jgi:acid phosphatase
VHEVRDPPLRRAVARPGPRAALTRPAFAAALLLAAPEAPAEREARLAFLGDMGTGDAAQMRVRDQLLRWAPPLVFLLGDNVYPDGSAARFRERFDDVYAPVMARGSAFHAALGNHDVRPCPAAALDPLPPDASAYDWRARGCDVEFHLTHREFGYVRERRYYSVPTEDAAEPLAEVFVLDSNTLAIRDGKLRPGREDAIQLEWLDRALAASRARWKLVTLHHPPHTPLGKGYFLGVVRHSSEPGLLAQLGPILRRHDVDAVLAGHNHFYARMQPQAGVRYFVSGGGGSTPLYDQQPKPGYVAAGGKFLHILYVRLTEARFEYWAIDDAGRSRDAGFWAKGDPADTPFPLGSLPPE